MKRRSVVRSARRTFAVGVFAWAAALACPAFTLIVAPARYSVLQVAFDVLARSPAVLVSYQNGGASGEPALYVWSGTDWSPLSLSNYREGNFLQQVPDQAVLLGDEATLPASLAEASSWMSNVVRVRDLTTGVIVNEFGHILKWGTSEWNWFARRYNLDLRDESEARRKSSWYDQPGPLPDRPHPLHPSASGRREARPVPVVTHPGSRGGAIDDVAPVAPAPSGSDEGAVLDNLTDRVLQDVR